MEGTDEFDGPPPPVTAVANEGRTDPTGAKLAAYSFGRRLVFRSFFDRESDPPDQMFTLALIFTLTLSDERAKAALFDRRGLREELLTWIEKNVKPGNYKAYRDLANEIVGEPAQGQVAIQDSPGAEKKTV